MTRAAKAGFQFASKKRHDFMELYSFPLIACSSCSSLADNYFAPLEPKVVWFLQQKYSLKGAGSTR